MSDHTPGPWTSDWHTVHSPDGGIIAWCGEGRSEYDSDRAQDALFNANTRLIATAPELLEALECAEQFISNGVELGYIALPDRPDPALDTLPAIRAAIAKAKGEV